MFGDIKAVNRDGHKPSRSALLHDAVAEQIHEHVGDGAVGVRLNFEDDRTCDGMGGGVMAAGREGPRINRLAHAPCS